MVEVPNVINEPEMTKTHLPCGHRATLKILFQVRFDTRINSKRYLRLRQQVPRHIERAQRQVRKVGRLRIAAYAGRHGRQLSIYRDTSVPVASPQAQDSCDAPRDR